MQVSRNLAHSYATCRYNELTAPDRAKREPTLGTKSPLVVQDPFELNRNITSGFNKMPELKYYCEEAAAMCEALVSAAGTDDDFGKGGILRLMGIPRRRRPPVNNKLASRVRNR